MALKEKKSILLFILILFFMTFILQSCFLFSPATVGKGSLSVSITSSKSTRTIAPTETDLTITSYRVEGNNEDGIHSFTPVISTKNPITIDNLQAGNWSISVFGQTAGNIDVVTNTQTVTIVSGQTSSTTFDLAPIPGTGSMKLTLRWPEGRSVTKALGSYTKDGITQNFEWTLSSDEVSAGYRSFQGQIDNIATGSYTLIVKFYNRDTAVGPPFTDIVNVYNQLISTGNFSLLETSFQPEAPSFSPAAGSYDSTQTVTIVSATAGVELYYTIDGSSPGVDSFRYTVPVVINATTTLNAIAVSADHALSSISSAQYIIKAITPDGSLSNGATLIRYGSKLYVAGGKDNSGSPVSTVRSTAVNLDGTTTAALADDTSLPTSLANAAGIAAGKRLYILGGETPSGYSSTIYYAAINSSGNVGFGVPRVWLANPTPLPAPRTRAATVLRDGWVYLIGGITDSGITDSIIRARIYQDGKLGNWYPSSQTLPIKVHSATAAVLGDRLYVAGGIGNAGVSSGLVSYAFGSYGALSDRRIEASLPIPLYNPILAQNGDSLVFAGGYKTSGPSNEVYHYNSGLWNLSSSLSLDGEGPSYGRAAGSLWYLPRQFRNQDGATVSAPLRTTAFALSPEAPEMTPGSGLVPNAKLPDGTLTGMPLTILAEPGVSLTYTKDGGVETAYNAASPPTITTQSNFTAKAYLGTVSSPQIARSFRVKTAAIASLITGTLPIREPGNSNLDTITIQEPTNNAAYPSGFEPATNTMYEVEVTNGGTYRLAWADSDTNTSYSARLILNLFESDLYTEVPDLTETMPVAALTDATSSPLSLELQAGTYYLLAQDQDGLKGRTFGLSLAQE